MRVDDPFATGAQFIQLRQLGRANALIYFPAFLAAVSIQEPMFPRPLSFTQSYVG